MCFNLGVALNSAITNETNINVSGFPYYVEGIKVNDNTHDQMYWASGSLGEWEDYINASYYTANHLNDDRMFFYNVDTSGGNSGGPIYITKDVYDKNGNNHQVYYDVIGINTSSVYTLGDYGIVSMGTRMNSELLRFYLHNTNPNW